MWRMVASKLLRSAPMKEPIRRSAMSAFTVLFPALLAAWPSPYPGEASTAVAAASPDRAEPPLAVWARMVQDFRKRDAAQVRIEQHIIWRVTPLPGPSRQSLTAKDLPPPRPPKMSERKMGECVSMSAIAGGRPDAGSRLLLFLRDKRMVAANLEKACSARDFYSGFYVDKPHADGKLCVDRDRILARNGARCEIASFRLLVADD
jgi:hypothetical protein